MLFAIDDSEIEIECRPHTILAALGVRDSAVVEAALNKLKQQFGLMPTDELKWNGMRPIPQQKREALSQELMILLHSSIPLIVINEGRDKQRAAERSAEQIADFLKQHPNSVAEGERVALCFDEEIIENESRYQQFLFTSTESSIASATFASVHSHENAAIQLADVLAGFNRLATEVALGRGNKHLLLREDPSGMNIEIDLLSYISISLRWAMWGEVPPPLDLEDVKFDSRWPFKHVGGLGFRIHSTITHETIARIYDSRVVYMGCLH